MSKPRKEYRELLAKVQTAMGCGIRTMTSSDVTELILENQAAELEQLADVGEIVLPAMLRSRAAMLRSLVPR